jgi:hypothetical protein
MLTVTAEAAQYLKTALVGVQEPENACFRLRLGQKGADLALDQTRPGDETVEHEGEVLLTLEPSVAQQVADSRLEYDDEKSRLVLAGSDS